MNEANIKNLIASINARLQNRAREAGRPFMEVLQYYGNERFLYRLSKTGHQDKFVLKGGLVFYCMGLTLRRPTLDIDLRGFTSNAPANLVAIAKDICSCPVSDDGLLFDTDSIEVQNIIPDAEYQGVRLKLTAKLGRSVIPIQVDIGFTDEIVPRAIEYEYPRLLRGMDSAVIRVYTRESIVSEKYHAMVYLNELNSRLKDFYDIWMLSEQFDFDGSILAQALETTFRKRATEITKNLPISFSENFAASHQVPWEKFLAKNKILSDEIQSFTYVIDRIQRFLRPPVTALANRQQFMECWKAGEDWM